MAIDIKPERVEYISSEVTYAVALNATDKKVLASQNIQEFDAVVIAIGEDFESLLLCAVNLIELKCPRIIAEPNIDFMKLTFEEFSAFATVGLSTGITSDLSSFGKAIIISSMFIGRVGVLSIAMVLSHRVVSRNYQYAKESVMVG
jgi:Trk-type K+ transport system membrane component